MRLDPSALWAFCSCFIIRVSNGPAWTGRGLSGSCFHCSELGLASSIGSGMLSLPCVELWSLPASTSWDSTQVLLPKWGSSEPLEEQPCFFCVEMARNSANGCPTRGVPIKGRSCKRSMMGGGVSERQAGLLEGPGVGDPSGLGAAMGLGHFHPVMWWSLMPHLYNEEKPQKECTRPEALLILPGLPFLLEGCVSFLDQFCLFPLMFFTSLIHQFSYLQASFGACSPSSHSSSALAWF